MHGCSISRDLLSHVSCNLSDFYSKKILIKKHNGPSRVILKQSICTFILLHKLRRNKRKRCVVQPAIEDKNKGLMHRSAIEKGVVLKSESESGCAGCNCLCLLFCLWKCTCQAKLQPRK